MNYLFCDLQPQDIAAAVAVYNSNAQFVQQHLGMLAVDAEFMAAEVAEMQRIGFRSTVICDAGGAVIGVADYRAGAETYLSLLMLDAAYQGQGIGRAVYTQLEAELRTLGCRSIRIDVVDGYAGNVKPFWLKLGFAECGRTDLSWGNKTTSAAVMRKSLV